MTCIRGVASAVFGVGLLDRVVGEMSDDWIPRPGRGSSGFGSLAGYGVLTIGMLLCGRGYSLGTAIGLGSGKGLGNGWQGALASREWRICGS